MRTSAPLHARILGAMGRLLKGQLLGDPITPPEQKSNIYRSGQVSDSGHVNTHIFLDTPSMPFASNVVIVAPLSPRLLRRMPWMMYSRFKRKSLLTRSESQHLDVTLCSW